MDTSETYVKMCEKAEEIQKIRHSWSNQTETISPGDSHDYYGYLRAIDRMIWLPRQDQLQEMVCQSCEHPTFLQTRFFTWITNATYLQYQSMEQLWLAFVMKKKYGKIWNGEKWL